MGAPPTRRQWGDLAEVVGGTLLPLPLLLLGPSPTLPPPPLMLMLPAAPSTSGTHTQPLIHQVFALYSNRICFVLVSLFKGWVLVTMYVNSFIC